MRLIVRGSVIAMTVTWNATSDAHPARDAARRSMDAVAAKDKDGWIALFAEDGVVEDPVGPSMFDERGQGHHGHDAIAAFWDATIANTERIDFEINGSYAAGDEVANVGTITTTLAGGAQMRVDGVFSYRVATDGKIRALRAFWEFDRAMATLEQP
jgi:ketosteroid isomerase-like protein